MTEAPRDSLIDEVEIENCKFQTTYANIYEAEVTTEGRDKYGRIKDLVDEDAKEEGGQDGSSSSTTSIQSQSSPKTGGYKKCVQFHPEFERYEQDEA